MNINLPLKDEFNYMIKNNLQNSIIKQVLHNITTIFSLKC